MTTAHSLVQTCAGRGEALIADAAAIGDQEAMRLWRLRKAGWAAGTVTDLRDRVDAESLHAFERAVRASTRDPSAYEGLPAELDALRRGVAVLADLAEQTAKRG